MRKFLILLIMFLLLITKITFSQACTEWNETTYYQPGDRVIYNEKAYKALVMIWYWPPPHPIYWEQVPYMDCYVPENYTFNFNVSEGGIVTVNKMPDGTVGTFGPDTSFDLTYENDENIELSVQIIYGYKLFHWAVISDLGDFFPTDKSIEINVAGVYYVYCVCQIIDIDTVIVHLAANGSVTFDTLPDGTVDTFDQSDGYSVSFNYFEDSEIILTANPDAGYELIDWGDDANTTTNPLHISMKYDKNYEFYPTYDIASELFKLPLQCHSGDHMKVQGRSRYYGKAVIHDDLEEKGNIIVRGKHDRSGQCLIENNHITIDNTHIRDDYLHSPAVDGDLVKADNVGVHNTTRADTIIAERVLVDMEVFPDFVFNKDYNLQSIDNVENYIKDNGRLPRMPSAEEAESKGMDMADMYSKLMQQVEEATLYIIQLHKRLNDLESDKAER